MSKKTVSTRLEAQEWMVQHKKDMKKKYGRSGFNMQALANCINDVSGLHLGRQTYDSIARGASLPREKTAKAILAYREVMENKPKPEPKKADELDVLFMLHSIDERIAELVELLKKQINPLPKV